MRTARKDRDEKMCVRKPTPWIVDDRFDCMAKFESTFFVMLRPALLCCFVVIW